MNIGVVNNLTYEPSDLWAVGFMSRRTYEASDLWADPNISAKQYTYCAYLVNKKYNGL